MSLRLRLMAAILMALLVSLGVAAGIAGWRAVRSVRSELTAATAVGAEVIRQEIGTGDPARIVANFNGERHVVASLIDPAGATTLQSQRRPDKRGVPGWFVWLVTPDIAPPSIAVPPQRGGGAILLRPDPVNEAGEAWAAIGDSALGLLVFGALAGGLTLATAGRALRPLSELATALDRVGPDNYGVRVPLAGPPELRLLAGGFNRMGERLAAVEVQNCRLNEQLLTMQDEERADLARDLHDEVGPFLFSINVSVAMIERSLETGGAGPIAPQLRLIREDVGHVQAQVKTILARLRPIAPLTFGMASALGDIAAFWRARRPGITIELAIAEDLDQAGEKPLEAAYRIAQEAISNAVRHGEPRSITIQMGQGPAGLSVRVADDGCKPATGTAGHGLAGMRERVAAMGGTLAAGPERCGGWLVEAVIPAAV